MTEFYTMLKSTHYFVMLALLVILIRNIGMFLYKRYSKASFGNMEDKSTLIALIIAHVQLLLGVALLFMSPLSANFAEMGAVMKDSYLRLMLIEHPTTMILGVVFVTIGRVRLKKKTTDDAKYKTAIIFFSIALVLFLARIPWAYING